MILFRANFQELWTPFSLTAGVMSFILIMQQIYRLINLMAERGIGLLDVSLLMVFLLPQTLSVTIPLGVVGAVFITIIRQSNDSELIVARSTGRSMWNYALPFLAFGGVATLMTLLITLWLHPVGFKAYLTTQARIIQLKADENLQPGKFNFDFGNKAILVGGKLPNKEVKDIFISDRNLGVTSPIITARNGRIEIEEESKQVFLKLEEGTIFIQGKDPTKSRTIRFTRMDYQLALGENREKASNKFKQLSSRELIGKITALKPGTRDYSLHMLELYYRLTLPLACFVFALAAVPMAIVDPRSGKSGSYLRAIFLVLVYYIIWLGFKDIVQRGDASPNVLWLPLLLILSYGLLRLWQSNSETLGLSRLLRFRRHG